MFWANTKTHSKDSYFHCCAVNGMQTFERFHFSSFVWKFCRLENQWKCNQPTTRHKRATTIRNQWALNFSTNISIARSIFIIILLECDSIRGSRSHSTILFQLRKLNVTQSATRPAEQQSTTYKRHHVVWANVYVCLCLVRQSVIGSTNWIGFNYANHVI